MKGTTIIKHKISLQEVISSIHECFWRERELLSFIFAKFLRKFTKKIKRLSEMMEEKSERKDLSARIYKK
jgi:dolichol kinase